LYPKILSSLLSLRDYLSGLWVSDGFYFTILFQPDNHSIFDNGLVETVVVPVLSG